MPKPKVTQSDPFFAREAQNYQHPVPSREYILLHLEQRQEPLDRGLLAQEFKLTTEEEHEGLRRRLRAMERDGQLVFNRGGRYGLPDKLDLLRGRVAANRDGFGFVIPEQGGKNLFLSPRQMRGLFHDDVVLARMIANNRKGKGRSEGVVVRILERNTQCLVGRYSLNQGISYVMPENPCYCHSILVPTEHRGLALEGQIVTVEIIRQPEKNKEPLGKVVDVLGHHLQAGMAVEVALRSFSVRHQWPDQVNSELVELKQVHDNQTELIERIDLSHLPFVTIDGQDAKDFDDALYCEAKKSGGWRLLVAIADVSHYVRPDSAVDEEAYLRSTSVYFPNRVVPMLPTLLSTDLCSLLPKQRRRSLVCEMTVSCSGRLSGYQFYPAWICSHARLTYQQTASMLYDNDKTLIAKWPNLQAHLQQLNNLYQVLKHAKHDRGAIEFESTEPYFIFTKQQQLKNIVPISRNDAHRIIEECMILANVAAARFLKKHQVTGLYRVHEPPAPEKIKQLRTTLNGLGLSLKGERKPAPGDYTALLNEIIGRPEYCLLQTLLLRSLSQAHYHVSNTGHFGLALNSYTHFTSPIRRYPDLIVHRAIWHVLQTLQRKLTNSSQASSKWHGQHRMQAIAEHCSLMERKADEASRSVVDSLKCQFMADKLEQQFEGVISGVTGFGFFVTLPQFSIDGLVHVSTLVNEYYHFDANHLRLVGEHSGRVYRIGGQVKIRVVSANIDNKRIDFELAETEPTQSRRTAKPKTARPKKPSSKKTGGKKITR